MEEDDVLDFSELPDVSALHPELDEDEQWFAAQMKARENAYEAIFGQSVPEGQILSPSDPELTINWPGGGIYQYAPDKDRRGWTYVTHGLAQPDEPSEDDGEEMPYSGLGIELVMSAREQSMWVPDVLLSLVRYLLFHPDARLIEPGHRLPSSVFSQIDDKTELSHMLAVSSGEYVSSVLLPEGMCDLVHLMGITRAELERAKSQPGILGSVALSVALVELGVGFDTELRRACATKDPRFEEAWERGLAIARELDDEGKESEDD
jgi:hypothetical protein